MNVLLLHSELGVLRGGGENFSRNLFQAFAKRGHRIQAAFVADLWGRYPLPLPLSIEPIPLPGWWSSDFGQAVLSSARGYLPCRGRFDRHWDRLQQAVAWRAFAWHKNRFRVRVEHAFAQRWHEYDALYVHGDTTLASGVSRYAPTVLRLPGPVTAERAPMLRQVHAVCANGDALVRVRAFLGDHVTELPVGLDTDAFAPGPSALRSTLGWAADNVVLGYVGRLAHLKGVDLLAAAFHEMARLRSDVRLLIIGSGEQQRQIRTVLDNELARGVAHVELAVDHAQLPAWYRAMDLLVMPSRYENHSNALLEAMACGVPFLASDVGGNRALSETGAGWLFESESISSLMDSLHRLVDERPALKSRGTIATCVARHQHSWAASAERLERIIESHRRGHEVSPTKHVCGR